MTIRFEVSVEDPNSHYGQFAMTIPEVAGPTVDLVLPSWAPGAYHIVDRSKSVYDLTARAGPEAIPLAVERVEKSRWRIQTQGHATIHVRYTVYGYKSETEGLDITSDHFFVNAVASLPYVDGRKEEPYEVAIKIPSDWQTITELALVDPTANRFRAENYDELVDSPIDSGRPVVLMTRPMGIPHRISICGYGGNFESHRLEEDLTKIVEAAIKMVGSSPLTHYTFFVHLAETSDGALEHLNSNSGVFPRGTFRPEAAYRRFLSTEAHEYFHLYNVKRLRPKVLGPFDYTKENYTRLLWLMEGTTDYFADLILRRAGITTPAKMLENVAVDIAAYKKTPGRHLTAAEDASLLAWIDLYQRYEESPNRSVSYYMKGTLASFVLDLELRHRSENRVSMESVFRYLWEKYGRVNRTLGEDEVQPIFEAASGLSLGSFFDRYIRGTEEIDFDAFAQYAGLTFGPKPKPPEPDDEGEAGYLGITFENFQGRVRVNNVLSDGPGRRMGLYPKDELVAIGGERLIHEDFQKFLHKYPPGTSVELDVFRRGWLTHLTGTMGKTPPEKYQFTPVAEPTALAKSVYAGLFGAPWEPAKKDETPAPSA
jgi:predicted metalloprotease with PDZ domain